MLSACPLLWLVAAAALFAGYASATPYIGQAAASDLSAAVYGQFADILPLSPFQFRSGPLAPILGMFLYKL